MSGILGALADSYAELRAKSLDELVELYDQSAPHVVVGIQFIRDEIAHREREAAEQRMIELTRQIEGLTKLVTVFTVIAAVAAVLALFVALTA